MTTISCVDFVIDIQGEFLYTPPSKSGFLSLKEQDHARYDSLLSTAGSVVRSAMREMGTNLALRVPLSDVLPAETVAIGCGHVSPL